MEASRSITKEAQADARRFAQKAISLYPGYSAPQCIGFVCTVEARHGSARDKDAALQEARACAKRALEIDSFNPEAHAIDGFADAIDGKIESAIENFSKALALSPNHADVAARLSLTLSFSGQIKEAIRVARQAITQNPHYAGWYAGILGFALRLAGNYD